MKYPKRERAVEDGEETGGPKRPRRLRVLEGAYKQTAGTTEMIADIFTKALDKTSFMKFRNLMVKDVRV